MIVLAVIGASVGVAIWQVVGQSNRPELHPFSIALKSPANKGERVKVTAGFENTGDAAASAFNATFFRRMKDTIRWEEFATKAFQGLQPNEKASFDTELETTTLEPGVHEIRILVDSNDEIPEKDETNNELITSVRILEESVGAADLRVENVQFEPPSPVMLAQEQPIIVQISSEISNVGESAATAFKVEFRICRLELAAASCPKDPKTGSEIFLPFEGNVRIIERLAPKEGKAKVSVELPVSKLGLEPATYKLKVEADPPEATSPRGQVAEQDERNNELIALLTLQGPELFPVSLSFSPSLVRQRDKVKLSALIANTGTGPANNFDVAFLIGGIEIGRRTLSLSARDRKPAEVELDLTQKKFEALLNTQPVKVRVDPDNKIPEQDETNNELIVPLTIREAVPGLAELHPKSIQLSPASPVEEGQNPPITVVSEVENTGKAKAENFSIEFLFRQRGRLTWLSFANVVIEGLAVEEVRRVSAPLNISQPRPGDLPLAPGIYEICVIVDPDPPASCEIDLRRKGKVEELDEANNRFITTLTILTERKPDLVPLTLALEPALVDRPGPTVFVSARIQNIGDAPAGPFVARFTMCAITIDEIRPDPCARPTDFRLLADVNISGLGIGEIRELKDIRLETLQLRAGLHIIRLELDPPADQQPRGQVLEQNELNNMAVAFLVIVQPEARPRPDLRPILLIVQPPRAFVGQPVDVTLVVVNIGSADAGEFTINFLYRPAAGGNEVRFATVTVPGLARGAETIPQVTLNTRSLSPGDFIIRAVVDPDNRIEELNEINNQITTTLRLF